MSKLAYVLQDVIVAGDGTVARSLPRACYAVQVFNSAGNPRWQLGPRLRAFIWDDDGVFKDGTDAVEERGSGSVFAVPAFATTDDAIYVGSDLPFRGIYIDLVANDQAATLTVNYWDGTEWATTSATDGTDSSGDTLKVDGDIYFAPPADWVPSTINGNGPYYYVQLLTSATLDENLAFNEIALLNVHGAEDMSIGPFAQNNDFGKLPWEIDTEAVGSVECTGDAANEAIVALYFCRRDTGLVANV